MSLPISVVVPHTPSRSDFFERYCLPSILANDPEEILVEDYPGSAQEKRNKGAERAGQEFLFFCDDDIILASDCLKNLWTAIGGYDFAYGNYQAANHPTMGFHEHRGVPFDAARLRQGNYISTMTLIRRSAFPGFDESIERLQDWDLFLTMVERGSTGIYVPEAHFIAFWLDQGITKATGYNEAVQIVRRKHS